MKIKITTTIIYFQKNARIKQLKNNDEFFFDVIIMVRFGETKVAKAKFYAAKKSINIYNVNIDSIVTSELIQKQTNSE